MSDKVPVMPEIADVPKGAQAIIITPKHGDLWSPSQCEMLNEHAESWKRALGCNVVFMSAPIEIHTIPDNTVQYGIQSGGMWVQHMHGAYIGTKAEMLLQVALWKQERPADDLDYVVVPLPTE